MTATPVDREARWRLDETKRQAGPLRERGRPGTFDVVADHGPVVEVGRDLRPERDLTVRNRPVAQLQRALFAPGVRAARPTQPAPTGAPCPPPAGRETPSTHSIGLLHRPTT